MLASYKILTVTHKRADLKSVGDYVIKASDPASVQSCLANLKRQFQLDELFYLPTCNRVMYFFTTSQVLDEAFVSHFFQHINPQFSLQQLHHLKEVVQVYEGEAAVEHFLQVAASMDSMVIGERQILRQLREAYEQCQSWGITGEYLRIAYRQAVAAAKSVYANTRIGEKPISIVSLAIQKLLKTQLEKTARILLIGAGQTNELAAKFLTKHGYNNVVVFNRSLHKAEKLAESLSAKAYPLKDLSSYEGGFDCIIICTGSKNPLLTTPVYHQLLQGDSGRKIIIDLAIPHNVDAAVPATFDVNYIEIDGLRHLAKVNLAFRAKEVERAQVLLHQFLADFPNQLKQRQLELAMREVPVQIKAVKHKALTEVFHKEVSTLDDNTRALLEEMMGYMEKKCIGIPMRVARKALIG